MPFTGPVSALHAGEAAAAFIRAVAAERAAAPVFDLNGAPTSVERWLEVLGALAPGVRLAAAGAAPSFPADLSEAPVQGFLGDYGAVPVADGIGAMFKAFSGCSRAARCRRPQSPDGGLGVRSPNAELRQRALNPPGEVRVKRFGWTYAVGDKVMQAANDDKDVSNGDLGFIARIDLKQGEVVGDFDGQQAAYDVGELDELMPAYATTVHRAQGSEYAAVVVPLVTPHWGMLRRNLVDTAVTRGKRRVVGVGQPKALALAVRGARGRGGGGPSSGSGWAVEGNRPDGRRRRRPGELRRYLW